jgi:hypothetical protein
MNVRHQPDDFMHVKRFTNLDTGHHDNNEALSSEKGHSLDSENDLEIGES